MTLSSRYSLIFNALSLRIIVPPKGTIPIDENPLGDVVGGLISNNRFQEEAAT